MGQGREAKRKAGGHEDITIRSPKQAIKLRKYGG
jgi:hypothetical protein